MAFHLNSPNRSINTVVKQLFFSLGRESRLDFLPVDSGWGGRDVFI